MTTLQSLSQIASSAQRLSLFAERNGSYSFELLSQTEQRRRVPSAFQFSTQIQQLNAMISSFCQDGNGLSEDENHVFTTLAEGLEPTAEPINGYIQTLNSIKTLAMTYLGRDRIRAQAREETSSPVASGIVPIHPSLNRDPVEDLIDDLMPEEEEMDDLDAVERQQINNDDIERLNQEKDALISHTKFDHLQECDSMLVELYTFDNPWRDALDNAHWGVYDLLPALVEGRLIQKSSSYGAYQAAHPNSIISEVEYGEIHSQSFQWLAAELGKGLDSEDGEDSSLSPLMCKLKLIANNDRANNERIVSLGLKRQEEVARHKALDINDLTRSELSGELRKAMESESGLFIEEAIENHLPKIKKDALNELALWCAARGRFSLLSRILDSRPSHVTRQTFCEAMDQARDWEHKSCYDLLFARYPHQNAQARKELLASFALNGNEEGVDYLLSKDYPHGFGASAIDEAFEAIVDGRQFHLIRHFFAANVRPYDLTMAFTFQSLCNERRYAYLEEFFQPEIANCLGEDSALFLLENLFHMENQTSEIRALLNQFFDSPLYDLISKENLVEFARRSIEAESLRAVHAILNSRRGGEIGQIHYEELLIGAFEIEQPDTLLLLDCPHYPNISGRTLGVLIQGAAQTEHMNLFRKVLSKVNPNDPIPRSSQMESFAAAAKQGYIQVLNELLRYNPALNPSIEEIDPLIIHALAHQQADTAFLLAFLPNAVHLRVELLSYLFLLASSKGATEILQIPFKHRMDLPHQEIQNSVRVALKNRQIEAARTLLYLRSDAGAFPQPLLRELLLNAACSDRLDVVEYLMNQFSIELETLEAAYAEADRYGRADAAAAIWNRIWHLHLERPEPPEDISQPSEKRQRIN